MAIRDENLKYSCNQRWWRPQVPAPGLWSSSEVPERAWKEESAGPTVSLEHLEKGRSYRKMICKSGLMKSGGEMADEGCMHRGEWQDHSSYTKGSGREMGAQLQQTKN